MFIDIFLEFIPQFLIVLLLMNIHLENSMLKLIESKVHVQLLNIMEKILM